MDRKDFLKKAGIVLLTGPFVLRQLGGLSMAKASGTQVANCVLLPFQTGGPFYLDPEFNRVDIRETLTGIQLDLKLTVIGVQNCAPIPNAVVNVWHSDTHGGYSTFGAISGNYADFTNETWLRGYQTTDANGECNFTTIFPGYYPGRATHIHFDVHVGFNAGGTVDTNPDASSLFLGQMYFEDQVVSQVYTNIAPYSTWGNNPTGLTNDVLLGQSGQVGDLTVATDMTNFPNSISGEFCIGLNQAGVPTGLEDPKGLTHFELRPNHPNPFRDRTDIDFTMKSQGQVTISIFDLEGRLVSQLAQKTLPPGEYSLEFDRQKAGIAAGSYLMDMIVHTQDGIFRQSHRMLIH